jgi:putative transposase
MDDSSRKILAGGEFNDAKENAISLMDNVLQEYSDLYGIRDVLTDRGSQFYSNKRDKDNNAENAFEKFLEGNNIKHIISRINNPQTNGKVEKWFHLYEKYRKDFETFEDLVNWYNRVRYHESLDTDYYLQTPEEAFWSRLPEESKLGNFYKIMGVE